MLGVKRTEEAKAVLVFNGIVPEDLEVLLEV